MTDYFENEHLVKPGDVRWVHGRKRVTVGERIGRSLTGSVFPMTEYQCTDGSGAECVVEFKDLWRLEDALPLAEVHAPVLRQAAESSASTAAEWENALRQMQEEVRQAEEAQRGTLENAVPLMHALDEQVMDFLPSDATGYIIVGTTVPMGSLDPGDGPRVQYLFGVYPNGKVNIDVQPITRGGPRLFGAPEFVAEETSYGVRMEFDLQTGYTQAKNKPAGFIAKLDTDETNDD